MILFTLRCDAICPLYRNGSPGATLRCNTPRTVCRCVVLRPPSPVLVNSKKQGPLNLKSIAISIKFFKQSTRTGFMFMNKEMYT